MPRMIGSHGSCVPVAHAGDAITFALNGACVRATLLKSTETQLDVTVEAADGSFQFWEIGREEEWKLGWFDSDLSRITTSIADLLRNSHGVVQQVEPVSNTILTARAVPLTSVVLPRDQSPVRPFLRRWKSSSAPSTTRTARARWQPSTLPRVPTARPAATSRSRCACTNSWADSCCSPSTCRCVAQSLCPHLKDAL